MYQAIIFDFDGVIISSVKMHDHAWVKVASTIGINLSEFQLYRMRSRSRETCLNILLEDSSLTFTQDQKNHLMQLKNEYYMEQANQITLQDLPDGLLDLIHFCKTKRIKLGIGSSSRNARILLNQLGIDQYFDVIVDGQDLSNFKPHPEVFLKAARHLGVDPSKCLVVEDGISGIQAAREAMMDSVAFPDAFEAKEATYRFYSILNVYQFLQEIYE